MDDGEDKQGRYLDLRHDPSVNPELVAALQAQWDAVAVLMRFNVLTEVGQTYKGSDLFWGVPGPLQEHPVVWPARTRPRNEGLPLFVLSLPLAMDWCQMEALIGWLWTVGYGSKDASGGSR